MIKTGIYTGKEFPKRTGQMIEAIKDKKGEYRIRFSDGVVKKWIFPNEIKIKLT